jgi:cell division protein FtsW (lipid II flippase)
MNYNNINFYLSIIIAAFTFIMIIDYFMSLNFISNNLFIQIIIIIFAISIVVIVLQTKQYDTENNKKEYTKFIISIINTILIAIVCIAFVVLYKLDKINDIQLLLYQLLFCIILILNIVLTIMNV